MKINEIIIENNEEIEEGFWDSVSKGMQNNANALSGYAKGFGANELSHQLDGIAKKQATQKQQDAPVQPTEPVNYDIPPTKRNQAIPAVQAQAPVNYDIPPNKRGFVSHRNQPQPVAQPVSVAAKTKLNKMKTAAPAYSEPVGFPGSKETYVKGPAGWVDAKTMKYPAPANYVKFLDTALSQPQAESLGESIITEGGNMFSDVTAIKKDYVPGIIADIRKIMPKGIDIIPDIGSAGYKVESGDMDVFVDAGKLANLFKTPDEKYTKLALKQYIEKQGLECALSGRNVHVSMPVPDGSKVQVDLMIIPNAAKVAPFHQHGPSGQYNDPEFKGGQLFILYSSIAKALRLKFSPFEGKLIDRTTNNVVADDKDSVAKILLNKNATAADLANVNTILKALAADPQKDAKLAQAREDAKKGLIKLPESIQTGSGQWFRQLSGIVDQK